MSALFISLLTLVLLLISAFVVLIVLMQRTSQSGGMGAALGGGAAESAFGSETSNILTKGTIYGIIAFFVVALALYLIYQADASERTEGKDAVELISPDSAAPVEETGFAPGAETPDVSGSMDESAGTVSGESVSEGDTEAAPEPVGTGAGVDAGPATQ